MEITFELALGQSRATTDAPYSLRYDYILELFRPLLDKNPRPEPIGRS